MSKLMNKIIPHEEWVELQKDLTARQQVWEKARDLHKQGLGPKPGPVPRNWNDPDTGKASRWLQAKSFSNYDETRFGPDPIDTVIDRLGIFEGFDFNADIKHAEENSYGPTTLIDRTGTPEYRDKNSSHYPITMVNDADKAGVNLDEMPMFDSSRWINDPHQGCQAISDFIALDYENADKGAKREYGYDSFHIQRPGQMLMYHHDLYYAVIRDADPELSWKPEKLRRFVIFMEDWRPGHVWIVGNTEYSHWRKGECITWNWQDMPHGTANLSPVPRYSIHLTGYMSEHSFKFHEKANKDTRYRRDAEGNWKITQVQEDGTEVERIDFWD